MEVWKDITGFEGLYQVSNKGRIKSLAKNKMLKSFICGSGYDEVLLYKNGHRKPKMIHRMVAEAFVPNESNKREVNHKDGNKFNNDFTNLEWVTPSENIRHSYNVLNHKAFSRNVKCVETKEIFNSLNEAATKHGLKSPLIWKCCNGRQKTTGGFHWEYI